MRSGHSGLTLVFGFFWPFRLKARKASLGDINSLHSCKWFIAARTGSSPAFLPHAMSKNDQANKATAFLF